MGGGGAKGLGVRKNAKNHYYEEIFAFWLVRARGRRLKPLSKLPKFREEPVGKFFNLG